VKKSQKNGSFSSIGKKKKLNSFAIIQGGLNLNLRKYKIVSFEQKENDIMVF